MPVLAAATPSILTRLRWSVGAWRILPRASRQDAALVHAFVRAVRALEIEAQETPR